jgi:hypothetical protein
MKNLIFVFACLFSVSVFGQGWESIFYPTINWNDSVYFASAEGYSVQQTNDGGYFIVGTASVWVDTIIVFDGGFEIPYPTLARFSYIVKKDESGIEQWSQTYGGIVETLGIPGDSYESGFSGQQTTDGGFIIFGMKGSNPQLRKLDNNGVEQWNQTFIEFSCDYLDVPENYGVMRGDVKQTTDGGYIITGTKQGEITTQGVTYDAYIIKTDDNGEVQWSQMENSTQIHYYGESVQQTTDGGYVTSSTYRSLDANLNQWGSRITKRDGNGVVQWLKTNGASGRTNVQQTADGGYIFTDGGSIIKIDSNGVQYFDQSFSGRGRYVQQTTDGGYIIAGSNSTSNGSSSVVNLVKTDGNGIEQWNHTFGGNNNNTGYSVQQTTDGGYIIVGGSGSSGYLIKTDSEGTLSSSFTIPTPSNRKLEKVVDVLGREVNHTTNQILFHIYDDGSVEKKFVVE